MDDRPLEPVGRFDWERIVKATDTTATVKLVALMLATFGDRNGARLRPGVDRLSAACGLSERATRAALGTLRDLGLIERTVVGSSMGRRAITDEHRLTRPPGVPVAGSPAPRSGDDPVDNSRSPAPPAGDRPGTPAPRSGSPASDDRTPASDDRNTGTTCTPSSSDHVLTKSSSRRGDDEDLAQKIADEQSWTVEHARRVVTDVLASRAERPHTPLAYVRKCIRSEPDKYRPAAARSGTTLALHVYDHIDDSPGDCGKCGLPARNGAHVADPHPERARQ